MNSNEFSELSEKIFGKYMLLARLQKKQWFWLVAGKPALMEDPFTHQEDFDGSALATEIEEVITLIAGLRVNRRAMVISLENALDIDTSWSVEKIVINARDTQKIRNVMTQAARQVAYTQMLKLSWYPKSQSEFRELQEANARIAYDEDIEYLETQVLGLLFRQKALELAEC